MKEELTLTHYDSDRSSVSVAVEYVRSPYYDHNPEYAPEFKGKTMKAYDVIVDGKLVGRVRQTKVSTARSPYTSRVRYGLGSHLEWSWDRHHSAGPNLDGRTSNYPGSYAPSRRAAAADMIGYSGVKVAAVRERWRLSPPVATRAALRGGPFSYLV